MTDAPAISTGSKVLDDIAEVIGLAAALKLSWAFRGIDLYIPQAAASDTQLVKAIGQQAADLLCEYYFRQTIPIPKGPGERAMVCHLKKMGYGQQSIAQQMGIGVKQVKRLLAKQRADDTAARQFMLDLS